MLVSDFTSLHGSRSASSRASCDGKGLLQVWQGGETSHTVELVLNAYVLTCVVHTAGALVKVCQDLLVVTVLMAASSESCHAETAQCRSLSGSSSQCRQLAQSMQVAQLGELLAHLRIGASLMAEQHSGPEPSNPLAAEQQQ